MAGEATKQTNDERDDNNNDDDDNNNLWACRHWIYMCFVAKHDY